MRTALRALRPDAICSSLASEQLGLLSRDQALQAGLSAAAIRRRLRNGLWHEVLPGVYLLPGASPSWKQRVLAALLYAGPDAYASHGCAAALRGWEGCSRGKVELITARRISKRVGIVVHNGSDLLPHERDRLGPIPLTDPARSLLDLGGVAPVETVEIALEDALRRNHVSLARLRWQLEHRGGKGRRGTAALRMLLDERPPGYRPKRSGLEVRVRRRLLAAGLPEPSTSFRCGSQAAKCFDPISPIPTRDWRSRSRATAGTGAEDPGFEMSTASTSFDAPAGT